MTQFAFLIDVDPERLHTLDAVDVQTAGIEASKVAAAAEANMEGTGTFVVWLVPLDQVTIYQSQVTVSAGYDVALTPVSVADVTKKSTP